MGTVAPKAMEVKILPEAEGETKESSFKSLSEMVPEQVPLSGLRETATALLPGVPFIRGRTVTQ